MLFRCLACLCPRVPLTFVGVGGQRWSVSADVGDTLLQTAEKSGIPLFAECGGGGIPRDKFGEGPMCRTCHVFIDNAHTQRALPEDEDEENILQWVDTRTKNSRLACEVLVTPELGGATVVIPEVQPLREEQW